MRKTAFFMMQAPISPTIPFTPHPFLTNPHAMTIIPRIWFRGNHLMGIPREVRHFTVAPETQIRGICHWQSNRTVSPTILLLHGLEGCTESHYLLGLTAKGWKAGFNIVRLNQRNCGGTEHLTPTLYHSGMSQDYRAIVQELSSVDGLDHIWMIGYSMGGNLTLKMAGEAGGDVPGLRGVIAVCPNIKPEACVTALERPANWMYQRYFLKRLKARLRRKAAFFPGKYDLSPLPRIQTMREFDNHYTAPDGGFLNAEEYYDKAGAFHVLSKIHIPTLILTSQDDPFIPFSMFRHPSIQDHARITLWAPRQGGHCGFFQRPRSGEDPYWAENRSLEFIQQTTSRCLKSCRQPLGLTQSSSGPIEHALEFPEHRSGRDSA